MSEPIPLPGVEFSVNDRGGEYYQKLQQLAAAVDTSITAYNSAVAAGTDVSGYLQQVQQIQAQINHALSQAVEDMDYIRTDVLEIVETAFSEALALPVIVPNEGSYTIPDYAPGIEIVCLGNATITYPNTPFSNAKYIVTSTDKSAVVHGVLGDGHQINDSDGVLHSSFEIEGIYQLNMHWLGAGVYRGF